ncbi:hypothetical protein OROGR_030878 [Orobanche gracilis]
MASKKETMDGGEKQEEEDPSEVDEKDGGEEEADEAGEEEENQDPVEKELAERNGDQEGEEVDEGEGGDEEDEGNQTEEDSAQKSAKKGTRREKKIEAAELKSPKTPGSERPTRERKMVERFKVDETPRSSACKPLSIEKGQGTQLKDIPNVAFKLSKRKADENLQLLHTILFGRKAKVQTLKRHIGLFSGFVWAENEEKQKAKVKEKIDKCTKEKLLDFCDVLNISVNKASIRKEEIVAKLFDFLESPRATTDALLADQEKSKKRKTKASASKSPNSSLVTVGKSAKKQKSDSESGKKQKSDTEEEDGGKSEPSHSEDDKDDDKTVPGAENEQEENELEDPTDGNEPKMQEVFEKVSSKRSAKKDTGSSGIKSKSDSKGIPVKASKASGKSTQKPPSSVLKKGVEAESKSKMTKKQKVEKESEKDTKGASSSKKKSKTSTKVSEKDQDDGSDKDVKEPSKEEMHAAVVDILKEVDFNKATLSDILKQLGKHFGLDLIHRKSEVKDIITEVIKNMSDDEDDDGSGDDSGEDEGDEA